MGVSLGEGATDRADDTADRPDIDSSQTLSVAVDPNADHLVDVASRVMGEHDHNQEHA